MDITHRQQEAERQMLQLLSDSDLDPPDEIEYGERCIRLLWHDRKVAVVVDLDDV